MNRKTRDPLLIYWLLVAICVLLFGFISAEEELQISTTSQYEQAKIRRTVSGRLDSSKIVSIALNNRDILYILVRHSKSRVWFPVLNVGIEYPDRTDPYCVIHWNGLNTKIKFYNLHVGDYYKISVLR